MSAVDKAAEVLRGMGAPRLHDWPALLTDALVELRGRLDALEGRRQAAPVSAIREEISRLREFSRSAPGIVDVNAEVTASALEKLDERLEALEVLHGAGQRQAAPAAPDASDLIALAAVVLDEAEKFSAIAGRQTGVDLFAVHAQRCRSLYQKLCAAASAETRVPRANDAEFRYANAESIPSLRAAIALCAVIADEVSDERTTHAERCKRLYEKLVAISWATAPPLDAKKVGHERTTINQLRVALVDARDQIEKLEAFESSVAYELGAERDPDRALDALKARLKERAGYKDFLLGATHALKLSGKDREDAPLALDTLKARLEEYQVLHKFLLDVTSALARPELVPGEAAPEEVLLDVKRLVNTFKEQTE